MYSFRIEQAVKAATVLHKNQVRKGEFPLPYSTHVVSVAFILADYTDKESIIVAGLLHDTLEDTTYTTEELIEDFGADVASLVKSVTEPSKGEWLERKLKYIKQIEKGGEDAMLVACADKIHNMRSTIEEYYDDHPRFIQDFGQHNTDRQVFYLQLSNAFNRHLKSDILKEFNHIFTEYKNFIEHVERTKKESKL